MLLRTVVLHIRGPIQSSSTSTVTFASVCAFSRFHTHTFPCAILLHLEGVHAGLLKYRHNSEGALGNGLPQVLDEAETLVHTRYQKEISPLPILKRCIFGNL